MLSKDELKTDIEVVIKDIEKTNIEREGWQADELGEQSAYQDATEFARQFVRGDESKGDPDKRDIAGSIALIESTDGMPHRKTAEEKAEDSETK